MALSLSRLVLWVFIFSYSSRWTSANQGPFKVARGGDYENNLRLESGCSSCFPHDEQACDSSVWNRCCTQEISCHEYHCRGATFDSTIGPNVKVRIKEDFVSDDDVKATLTKGMKGKIMRIDGQGDLFIKFFTDEFDDSVVAKHWVHKTTLWRKLELPGKAPLHRADRVINCMENCTVAQNCKLQNLGKKEQKVFDKCMQTCKVKDCVDEAECKEPFIGYQNCKMKTSQDGVCQASTSKEEKDEL
eukprot:TRINITY_DN10114_c0_g1_i4.p1 TRINITY_DN10114_c0_g1~~TRINITY_DN10114_c0_g1_i4.p1  ORF type:complete len:245 (-),score=31.04 TRINITY_DN10114_c0_g1_i4:70-804(-)